MSFRQRLFKAFSENDWTHLGLNAKKRVSQIGIPVVFVTSGLFSYNLDERTPFVGRWIMSSALGLAVGGLTEVLFVSSPVVVIGAAVAVPVLTVPVYVGIKAKEYFK
jgi:hypothetical protein